MRRWFSTVSPPTFTPPRKNTYLYRVSDLEDYTKKFFDEPILPSEKKVFFVRHAISYGNVLNLIYGHSDYELTGEGVIQATALNSVLSPIRGRFDEIRASTLRRTRQTGGQALGLGDDPCSTKMIRDSKFNEVNFGPLEGIYTGKMDYFEHELFFQM